MRRVALLAAAVLVLAVPAGAATPGASFYGSILSPDSTLEAPFFEPAIVRADGSSWAETSVPEDAVWSPDGSRFAHVDGNWNIVVANADGSGTRALTSDGQDPAIVGADEPDPTRWNAFPAWSPDGSALVWQKHLAAPTDTNELWVAAADGSGAHRLAAGAAPTWAPAEAIAALDGGKKPSSVVLVAPSDGSVRVVARGAGAREPRWSPDGQTLAFVADDRLQLVSATGGAPRTLWAPGLHGAETPWEPPSELAWAPDGTRLLFVSARAFKADPLGLSEGAAFSVPLSGGEGAPISEPLEGALAGDPPRTYGDPERHVYAPSFWPDGSRIFFSDSRDYRAPLWEMNPDGSCKQPFPLPAEFRSWRPGTEPGLGPLHCSDLGLEVAWPRTALLYRELEVPVTVWNDGDRPAVPRVVIAVDPYLHARAASIPCDGFDTELVDCTLPELAPHTQRRFTFTVAPSGAGAFSVHVRVLGGEADPRGNNDAAGTVPVQPCTEIGTAGPDVVRAGDEPGPQLCGLGGADVLVASSSSPTKIDAGAGNDTVHAVNGYADTIDCGPGDDTAYVEQKDTTTNCEHVVVRKAADPFNLAPAPHPERKRFTDFSATPSPDGRRIAFWRLPAGKRQPTELLVARADGTGSRIVARRGDGAILWSPDGRTLVFARRQLFAVPSSGGAVRQLTHEDPELEAIYPLRIRDGDIVDYDVTDCCLDHIDYDYEASVHLDGRQVPRPDFSETCFQAYCAYSPDGLAVLRPGRGDTIVLETASDAHVVGVGTEWDWTPDGKRVLYVPSAGPNAGRLISVLPDGSSPIVVSPAAAGAVVGYAVAHAGDRMALLAGPKGAIALWLVRMDGSDPQRVVADANAWNFPWWSPHDRFVAAYGAAGPTRLLHVLEPGHEPRLLVTWQLRDPSKYFYSGEFYSFAFGGAQDEMGTFLDRPKVGCGDATALFRVATATGRRAQITRPCRIPVAATRKR